MEQKISENKILNDKTSENRISEGRVVMTDPKKADSFYEESIKTLRTNLQFTGRGIRVIMISSCYPSARAGNREHGKARTASGC